MIKVVDNPHEFINEIRDETELFRDLQDSGVLKDTVLDGVTIGAPAVIVKPSYDDFGSHYVLAETEFWSGIAAHGPSFFFPHSVLSTSINHPSNSAYIMSVDGKPAIAAANLTVSINDYDEYAEVLGNMGYDYVVLAANCYDFSSNKKADRTDNSLALSVTGLLRELVVWRQRAEFNFPNERDKMLGCFLLSVERVVNFKTLEVDEAVHLYDQLKKG